MNDWYKKNGSKMFIKSLGVMFSDTTFIYTYQMFLQCMSFPKNLRYKEYDAEYAVRAHPMPSEYTNTTGG